MNDDIQFNRDFRCEYGVMEEVAPRIRRIVAENPGPYTFMGTGTYVVGRGRVAVIDPGPDYPEHVDALLKALEGEEITHQLITHTHIDHSPAAKAVKERTGARTYGFGPHGSGKYAEGVQVEAGGDMDFTPDVTMKDGDVIEGAGWSFQCVHTPGHTSNHLCYNYREENALFSGDHVMGWSTTVVTPPDGDMAQYVASLKMLSKRDDAVYFPTHGDRIKKPKPYLRALIIHRKMREGQILGCLEKGAMNIPDLVASMYDNLDPRLTGAATQSVFAHIVELAEKGAINADGDITLSAVYELG